LEVYSRSALPSPQVHLEASAVPQWQVALGEKEFLVVKRDSGWNAWIVFWVLVKITADGESEELKV